MGHPVQWVRRPKNERFNPKYTRSSFKHGGGNVKFWGCFSANGVGSLHLMEGITDRFDYWHKCFRLQTAICPFDGRFSRTMTRNTHQIS
jgi:hypothetical protein